MTLAVLISAYNDHLVTVRHVKECMASSRVPDEIIVVNDTGTPELKGMLEELEKNTKIIYAYILPPKIPWNYTGARNLAFWLSRGDYISLEDNDHIPHIDYYKDAIETLEKDPKIGRIKQHKRRVVSREDILNKPISEWKQLASRPGHEDCSISRREVWFKLKGYDERFAGAYGWSATDWKRRLFRAGFTNGNAGYMYVKEGPKTPGLSYRNYQYAREDQAIQRTHGILNFQYEYTTLN